MKAIRVQIVKFISDDQPGFAECKFIDASGKEHTVHDKTPIVTNEYLDVNSEYPQDGVIACEVISEWVDKDQNIIFTVTTEKPWDVDTLEGLTQFDLLEEQLITLK